VVAAFEQLHRALRGTEEGGAGERAAAGVAELLEARHAS
jgi:lipid-A-disaccharide synthase